MQSFEKHSPVAKQSIVSIAAGRACVATSQLVVTQEEGEMKPQRRGIEMIFARA